jgi:hypothetical protein
MTALPNPTPNGALRPNQSNQDPCQHDEALLVGGEVPIAVWRLDDRDDGLTTDPSGHLASRLAQRLVLVYTRRGEAVVDFDSDPNLQAATTQTSRAYLSVTHPAVVAELDALTEPVSLIVLRWPPRHATRTPAGITDLFAACRLIMTADTCAVAAVGSAEPGQAGTTYAQHLAELLPAAKAAGLTHVLQIIAVAGPGGGDQFVYYASPTEAESARQDQPADDGAPSSCIDLVVFTNRDVVPQRRTRSP